MAWGSVAVQAFRIPNNLHTISKNSPREMAFPIIKSIAYYRISVVLSGSEPMMGLTVMMAINFSFIAISPVIPPV